MSDADAAGALAGRTIAVTRPVHGAGDLAERLASFGAFPLLTPLVRIEPRGDADLAAAAANLARYDWVIFTSAMAVHRLASAMPPKFERTAAPRVAAVGTATAAAVEQVLGWPVTTVPAEFIAAAMVPAMLETGTLEGRRVLWPRALDARPAVATALEAAGATLDAPVAYSTVQDAVLARELVGKIDAGGVDAVTFTSPSAVAAYAAVGGAERGVVVAVIGPVTAEACRRHGIVVHVVPQEHTIAELVSALAIYLSA